MQRGSIRTYLGRAAVEQTVGAAAVGAICVATCAASLSNRCTNDAVTGPGGRFSKSCQRQQERSTAVSSRRPLPPFVSGGHLCTSEHLLLVAA